MQKRLSLSSIDILVRMEAPCHRVVSWKGPAAAAFQLGTREAQIPASLESLHNANHSLPNHLHMRKQAASAAAVLLALPPKRQGFCPACKSLRSAGFELLMMGPFSREPCGKKERALLTAAASQSGESEKRAEGSGHGDMASTGSVREDIKNSAAAPQLEPNAFKGVDKRARTLLSAAPSIISSIDELIILQKEAAGGAAAEVRSPDPTSVLADSVSAESRSNTDTSVSRQPSRPANKTWVRDSTGTMRRAVQPAKPSPSQGGPSKPVSPSRMKLPRHGAPRAAAVMRILYEARDLTTEGVLDQLAEAVQRSELNMIIKDLGVRGRTNKAFEVYHWMLQQGNERRAPDEITFNSIINVLSKHGQVEKAHLVFDMMDMVACRRNVFHYNALLSGYAKLGHATDALALFERMKGEGIDPDGSSYNILINACGRGKQLTRALALFEEMVANGLQATHITYTSLVGACGRDNRPFQALRIFQEATSSGVPPDRPMFNALLDALGRGSLFDEMSDVRRQMAERGFEPSLDAYRSMLASYKQGERYLEAKVVLDEMRKAGHDPGPVRLPV